MFSYRHAFHAGNFADVHKHAAWVLGICALKRKPAPFCLVDAWAGAGAYDLEDAPARRTGEWKEGIARALAANDPPDEIAPYLELVRQFNDEREPARYPGSPALASGLLRDGDRLVCLELHPAEYPLLKARFAGNARVHVHRRDAGEGLPALVPPAEKRGLVLLDPPYERRQEYAEVPAALGKAIERWPTGSYLLWYPILSSNSHVRMIETLAGIPGELLVQELVLFPEAGGLRGSGLAWINPPWQVETALERVGSWLKAVIGAPEAGSRIRWRRPE